MEEDEGVRLEDASQLQESLLQRYLADAHGRIIDRDIDEPIWLLSDEEWLRWFSILEEILSMPSGRRLAHAAEAHETWRLQRRVVKSPIPRPLFGRRKARDNWVADDWKQRSLGSLIQSSETEAEVRGRTISSMAAGIAVATITVLSGKEHRFRWQDSGSDSAVVYFEEKPGTLPAVKDMHREWEEVPQQAAREGPHPLDEAKPAPNEGKWMLMGEQMSCVGQDMLIRLGNNILPHIENRQRLDAQVEWKGISEETALVWDAFAEAARRVFVEGGEHVLIAEPRHWLGTCVEILSSQGLGAATTADGLDGNGGVKICLLGTVHPAISVGRLLGCWQRSQGRDARASWVAGSGKHEICLSSRRDIAAVPHLD